MNGVHDMGGMHGFGPVQPEPNEPVFHTWWEARVAAMTRAMAAWGKWNIDAGRHQRELIPPAEYLRMSYYEKWLAGLIEQLVSSGLVTREELRSGKPAPDAAKATPALTAAQVPDLLLRSRPYTRDVKAAPRFKPGDRVRTLNLNPTGHARLPRYAKGRQGVVHRHHGAHVFPDSNAHFLGEHPQHLYSVRFSARELWGPSASARDAVHLDLWEPYLEPV
jgi:nitrile hydratase